MRLNPGAFNRHLAHMGQAVSWRAAYACACVNPDSGQPDPKHQLCRGKGWLWDAGVDTVTGISAQQVTAKAIAAGLFEVGDTVATIPENSVMYSAGRFDRVLLKNSTTKFSQPLKRGAPVERLLFTVAKLTRVFWLDAQKQPVEGTLPQVDDSGNLSWPNGGAPPAGATYSLTGEKFDEYFVAGDLVSDRNHHGGARLPRKVTLRKWDLFGR